jgi:glyoxylase-like metal-dependent hydrolase (beta-lactamase superfamily II)
MSGRLARASGAPILIHRLELQAILDDGRKLAETNPLGDWGVPEALWSSIQTPPRAPLGDISDLTFISVDDGDRLPPRDTELRAMHTPGHTTGHLSVVAPQLAMVFTGDHVLPKTRPGFGLGGVAANPLGDYLESLERIAKYDPFVVQPAHEFAFRGLAERCEDLRSHQITRASEVEAIRDLDPTVTVWEIASHLRWTAGWANLDGINLHLALMQTAAHVRRLDGE